VAPWRAARLCGYARWYRSISYRLHRNSINFGITPGTNGSFDGNGLPDGTTKASYGIPNVLSFQTQPLVLVTNAKNPPAICMQPDGNCCNHYQAQTAHQTFPVAMADGSVHFISPSISSTTWTLLMLPRDGQLIPNDW
jgi:hypothetical protein